MERAAKLIKNKNVSRELFTDEDMARAVWPSVVGMSITAHTSRLKLVRTTLIVEVEDAIWQRQLHSLSRQILARVRKLTGSNAVQELEFRIGIPRREVQRAEVRAPSLFQSSKGADDDAETILDPVLKKVYRLSRRKATG